MTGLSVYDWAAPDSLCGGSPHVHFACTEGYVTVAGTGAVQMLTVNGLQEVELRPGTVTWFSPGTIHRAVNHDGKLHVVVVMQNSGLPEAGDAVMTFPTEVLASRESYRKAASLANPGHSHATDAAGARARRDLAVEGFLTLVDQVQSGNTAALEEFYRQGVALVADRFDEWEKIWRSGPAEAVRRTGEHLAAMREGRIDHLLQAAARVEEGPEMEDRKFGMCGRLDTYSLGPLPKG